MQKVLIILSDSSKPVSNQRSQINKRVIRYHSHCPSRHHLLRLHPRRHSQPLSRTPPFAVYSSAPCFSGRRARRTLALLCSVSCKHRPRSASRYHRPHAQECRTSDLLQHLTVIPLSTPQPPTSPSPTHSQTSRTYAMAYLSPAYPQDPLPPLPGPVTYLAHHLHIILRY